MKSLTYRSTGTGIAVTAVLWILLLLLLIFIKLPEKQEYRTINITLEPLQNVQPRNQEQDSMDSKASSSPERSEQIKEAEETQALPETEPQVEEIKDKSEPSDSLAAKKTEASSGQQTAKASENKKTDPSPRNPEKSREAEKAPETVAYKQSVEDLAKSAHESKSRKQVTDADWDSMFGDEEAADAGQSVKSTDAQDTSALSSSFGGNSASSQKSSTEGIAGKSSSSTAGKAEASSSVSSALSAIKSQTYSLSLGNGMQSRTDISVSASGNGVAVEMSNGRLRELLDPKKPYIDISEENARLLDSTRTVRITFTVLAEGTVPQGQIVINPSLPQGVESEIKQQISHWIFVSDPGGENVQAVFTYTLEIR